MRRLLVPLVTVTVAAAPSPAIASPRDLTATHKAILAGYALARAGVATIRVAQSRIESFNHKLAVECPGVGRGTPENEASQPMSYEVAVALWSIGYGSAASITWRAESSVKVWRVLELRPVLAVVPEDDQGVGVAGEPA